MSRIIVVTSGKGGVGKTTVTANLTGTASNAITAGTVTTALTTVYPK